MSNRSKKSLLLNPKFQLKLLGYFLALSLSTIAIFYAAVTVFFWKFHSSGIELGLPADHVFFRFLTEQKNLMNVIFLVTSILSTTALAIGGLVLSHKIAGPVHRLCQYFENLKSGTKLYPLKFREGDFFPEVPEYINQYLDTEKMDKMDDDKKNNKVA